MRNHLHSLSNVIVFENVQAFFPINFKLSKSILNTFSEQIVWTLNIYLIMFSVQKTKRCFLFHYLIYLFVSEKIWDDLDILELIEYLLVFSKLEVSELNKEKKY